jgi:cytochrome d ubiquinol oxidase subunit I
MEAHWQTNPPDTGAPWAVVAWPDEAQQKNRWALEVPNLLSFLSNHSFKGQVKGLREFPPADQPPIVLPFYAFRIMVLLGFIMFFMMIWSLWNWYKGRLDADAWSGSRFFWKVWLFATPIGFLATEMGWIVREVGRQPWIIYGFMRTSEGVSHLTAGTVRTSLFLFIAIYMALLTLFIYFTRWILVRGPDFASPIPVPKSSRARREERKSASTQTHRTEEQ